MKLRFAPSPTGYLHIGGARTALYNYLLAKQNKGVFVLRIEDTDLERSTPEAIQAILDGMNWLGLTWDEGPYYQTKRFDIYHAHIQKLLDENKAYPCFCTAETLEKKRAVAMAEKRKPMYDRTCALLDRAAVAEKIKNGLPHCIRFRSPDDGEITINDAIKGPVVVANKELDDLIIRRTDGSPTYNFVVVVDDVTMEITHVIRGDDHLNNTPRQIQLYQAFNYPLPIFAHVPMILGTDKKKLSKRHGATSVIAYRDLGFLPEALLNYLVRLGWSYKDQEVFSMNELIEKFNLESVSKSSGVFNPEKLLWLNGVHIRQTPSERLADLAMPFLEQKEIPVSSRDVLIQAVEVSKEKVKTIIELADMVDLFFKEFTPPEELLKKHVTEEAKLVLRKAVDRLQTLDSWTSESLHSLFDELCKETGLGLGKIAGPLRLLVSGKSISPGVFDMLRIIGKEESLKRIQKYL